MDIRGGLDEGFAGDRSRTTSSFGWRGTPLGVDGVISKMLFLLSLKSIDATDWWFYGLIRLMQNTEFRMALAVLVGFASVLLAAPSVIAWLRAKKIGDLAQSNHRDLDALTQEKSGTPTMGGILVGALLLSVLLFADLRESLVHFAMATTLFLALLGGFDDWLKLTAGKREGSGTVYGCGRSSSSKWACLSWGIFSTGIWERSGCWWGRGRHRAANRVGIESPLFPDVDPRIEQSVGVGDFASPNRLHYFGHHDGGWDQQCGQPDRWYGWPRAGANRRRHHRHDAAVLDRRTS